MARNAPTDHNSWNGLILLCPCLSSCNFLTNSTDLFGKSDLLSTGIIPTVRINKKLQSLSLVLHKWTFCFIFVDVHTEKKLPAVRRSWFRAFEVNLGVLYLLIVVGIMTRCEEFDPNMLDVWFWTLEVKWFDAADLIVFSSCSTLLCFSYFTGKHTNSKLVTVMLL